MTVELERALALDVGRGRVREGDTAESRRKSRRKRMARRRRVAQDELQPGDRHDHSGVADHRTDVHAGIGDRGVVEHERLVVEVDGDPGVQAEVEALRVPVAVEVDGPGRAVGRPALEQLGRDMERNRKIANLDDEVRVGPNDERERCDGAVGQARVQLESRQERQLEPNGVEHSEIERRAARQGRARSTLHRDAGASDRVEHAADVRGSTKRVRPRAR